MNAAELLSNSLSPNYEVRSTAEKQLESVARDNYQGYIHTLVSELGNEQTDTNIRVAAGLAFKNSISARDAILQGSLQERWLGTPETVTTPLKQSLLACLGTAQPRVGQVAAQCVSAVATAELPVSRWPDLIPNLLAFVGNQDNVHLRVATLVALGFICEAIEPEILAQRSNEILTAVVQGSRKEEPSVQVQLAAINALYNALDFIRDNFEREGERNYIMQVVCEATQSKEVDVQVGAYQCLVRIMSLYYGKMDFYMERALFGLTVQGMRSPDEHVALQAIEFWSTVSEEEIELTIEAQEAVSFGEEPLTESKNFAKMALGDILPVIFDLLTQQDEDADENDWNRSMAAAACLEVLARNIGDDIVAPVVPFVETGFRRVEWQWREAAVMAFGSILDGPDPTTLGPLVNQAIAALINMLHNDESLQVRDTVAWTLSKITEVMLDVLDVDVYLQGLVEAFVLGLQGSSRIVGNCCSGLGNLVAQLTPAFELMNEDPPTSSMSAYYSPVLTVLMPLTERSNNEGNARSAAFQTIATFVASSATDTLPMVQDVAVAMLTRQEALMAVQNQLVGVDDHQNWNDIQINICAVLQSVIHKSPSMVQPFADRIMTNLLGLLQNSGKNASVVEDVFATVGALAGALEAEFIKYLEHLGPFLINALASFEDWQVVQAAVYVTSDIARAISESLTPFAEPIMSSLTSILQSPVVNRSVKPNAITTIGEVALAIGSGFVPYLENTMSILSQAGSMGTTSDANLTDFVWTMREAIVDAFIGILNGMKISDPSPFLQYVPPIMGFLKTCVQDTTRTEEFVSASLGLIGDFGDTYQGAVKGSLMTSWVQDLIASGRQRTSSKQLRTNAAYAQKILKDLPA